MCDSHEPATRPAVTVVGDHVVDFGGAPEYLVSMKGADETPSLPSSGRRRFKVKGRLGVGLTVTMDADMRAELERLAAADEVSAAAVARDALTDYLPRLRERQRKRKHRSSS